MENKFIKVDKETFEKFIKEYPGKLVSTCYYGWDSYCDYYDNSTQVNTEASLFIARIESAYNENGPDIRTYYLNKLYYKP